MNTDKTRTNVKKAFTLVELLVVISIIALLLAILMPALKKVKDQANTVICMTRFKDAGTAFSLYVLDNKGKLPPGYVQPGEDLAKIGQPYWYFRIARYYDKKTDIKNAVDSVGLTPNCVKVFRCTTQDWYTRFCIENTRKHNVGWQMGPQGLMIHGSGAAGTFGYNPYFANEWGSLANDPWRSVNSCIQPSTLPLLVDMNIGVPEFGQENYGAGRVFNAQFPNHLALKYGWGKGNDQFCNAWGPAPNHSGAINYLFVDGHAETRKDMWPWHVKTDYQTDRRAFFHPVRKPGTNRF